ncbi:MAG: hypothetical protein Q7K57_48090, partial [Burkholderiaceae bacterium]|nr:hypothetical protein [Burkholderiaceae bacterium]
QAVHLDQERSRHPAKGHPRQLPLKFQTEWNTTLGACRAWGVESENRPQRGQFLPDLQAHSPAMGQKDGEKWTAAVDLQPTIPKSDWLLGAPGQAFTVRAHRQSA